MRSKDETPFMVLGGRIQEPGARIQNAGYGIPHSQILILRGRPGRDHHGARPTVFLPATLVLLLANRQLFAVTDSREPALGNPEGEQAVPCRLSPFGPERQIVLVGPSLVAVPFDFDPSRAVRP